MHYIYMTTRAALRLVIDTNYYEHQLMKAIVDDDNLRIRNCFYYGADLNSTKCHRYQETPLMYAVECGSWQALKELIALGADINKRSKSRDKITALFLACRKKAYGKSLDDQLEVIDTLIRAGANPNMAITGGVTPLMEACFQTNLKVVEVLLKYNANPNFIDERKNTALDICLSQELSDNLQQITERLKQAGALLSGETENQSFDQLHQKINSKHLFKSGLLLPNQTIDALQCYSGTSKKIKKYTPEIPSLFRSVLIGKSKYILYDSHQFFSTCEGCLGGISPHNYLGKGGEAKVKIAQDCTTGEFLAVRITQHIGQFELEILKLYNCLVDHIKIDGKHYIIQKLHKGIRLSEFYLLQSKFEPDVALIKIFNNVLQQVKILHENGYIHRDLAPDNVMIDPDTLEINCIDFGFSIKKPGLSNGFAYDRIRKGLRPLAPELTNSTNHTFPYSEQSDLFAIGMIFSELLAQCLVSNPHRIALLNIKQQMIADDPSHRKNAQHYIEVLATWYC